VSTWRYDSTYPKLFRAFAVVFAGLGACVLLAVLIATSIRGVRSVRELVEGLALGAIGLGVGLLYLRGWRDVKLEGDPTKRAFDYLVVPRWGASRTVRGSFDGVERIDVSGTINWVSVSLATKHDGVLYLRTLPRTRRGKAELRELVGKLRELFGAPVEVPDYITKWWGDPGIQRD